MKHYFKQAAKWRRYILKEVKHMANSLDGTICQLVREWVTDGLCRLSSQNGPHWAGGGTMLFCGRPARRLSLSCPSHTLSVLLMFLQSWGPPPPPPAQVPSRVQKKVPKGREDRGRQADCSSFRENDNIFAKDNRARGRRTVISNFLEQKNCFMILLSWN